MFTDKPVGKLPLSHGLGPMTLKMGERDVEAMRSLLPSFLMQAVSNPGVTQFRYHEETGNGYEYEERAICDGSIFLNSLKFFFKWLFTVFSITNKES